MGSFEIIVYHGGYFEKQSEGLKYVRGKSIHFGSFDIEKFSYWNVKDKISSGLFGQVHKIWHAKHNLSLEEGRHVIYHEKDAVELLEEGKEHGSVTLYLDHVDDYEMNEIETDDGSENEAEGAYVSTDSDNEDHMDDEHFVFDDSLLSIRNTFDDADSVKKEILKYSLSKRKDLKYAKSDRTRVTAECKAEGCPWRLHASFDSGFQKFKIKTFINEHRCTVSGKNSLFGRKILVDMFLDKLSANPLMKAVHMPAEVLEHYSVKLTLPQCRGVRHNCLQIIQRGQAVQFERLWDYVAELKRSNIGSTIRLQANDNVFRRMYICFSALSDGWRIGCRSVIHLDGAFLKWNFKGELLSAIGRDANDQLFLIAWALVDVENKKNWKWFVKQLVNDLGLSVGEGLTFISDQQKGLIWALREVIPVAEHRMCSRHIWANFKKKHNSDEVRKCFWAASKSYTEIMFQKNMNELKEYSILAYNDLCAYDPRHWSRAFFSTICKCDSVDNNFSESFNASIREARTKPVVQMLVTIRRNVTISSSKKLFELA